ncbi:MAG: hypothetical protein KME11_12970 [Timaviella obliquedivisa GSE-PSE-MK23-08B]|jgi:hypothetical protein|nr:hypothetical protein [Timaviella obliquedivisa GSE-PSE-MK23-08B]
MLTRICNVQAYFRRLGSTTWKQILLGQLILLLGVGWGDPLYISQGDRAFAQSASDSVLDRIPESTTAVLTDPDNDLFLSQILYAGVIVWIISLMAAKD